MTKDILLAHPWFAPSLAALIAIPLALLVHRIGGMVLLRLTRHAPVVHALLLNIQGPARIVLPLIALQMVWQAAPEDLAFINNVRHVNGLLFIAAATWLAIRAVNGIADGILAKHPHDVEDNLQARRVLTQTRVLARTAGTVLLVAGASLMLMTFPGARQVGASLLASAGVIGIVAGLAAKPVFTNLIAGLQIALAQPIRIDDVLVVEGEWGRVEEITGTFVVLRIWDDRRLILPLSYFIEKPFQNWTRSSAQLLGSVFIYADYGMPLAPLREEVERIVKSAPEWDGRFFNLRMTDVTERTMQIRVLCTAASSSLAFDLRCTVREGLIEFMQREYPQFLPRLRVEGDPQPQPQTEAEAAAPSNARPSLASRG
ncbi:MULTISPECIES: mechanosensitive ion channel domain-containing protein [unclassified Variovorax]|uniref:mechanosensitive ion channel family protein n=1 Tax=unclassified Variovorax TaxID=663243 RepID=UPI00076CA3B7|nr:MULTISPECIES: mechanosensitive ion channel domain-containing protein [unclassified Variovorax]KWT87268.1 Small-conductance mechanosensitive channel [Variovorax sp. WDL1]PNG51959.1 Miniconductance mechanosensitive channel MscM [Variovorax sp. B4]PNG54499.1 Miniconductance mechanosensitive channel MscM [Variovorax sp. B2]VTV15462.1 putative mechanosensitive channel protein [Variovorax sp. WDL1]